MLRGMPHGVLVRAAVVAAVVGGGLGSVDLAWAQCPVSETVKLTASDGVPDAWFGRGVAVSGDVAVVGATLGEDGIPGSGSAYVYRFDGSTWVEEAELTASDAPGSTSFPWFGGSVAIDGDVAVIGAMDDNAVGAAYVFRFDGNAWVEEDKLTPPVPETDARFGYDVAVSGPVIVVGAYRTDVSSLSDAGRAFVYRFNGSTWDADDTLTASDAGAQDYFGWSVSVSGDVAIVGASNATNEYGSAAGAAYIFEDGPGGWTEVIRLLPAGSAAGDAFGYSVSISGDLALIGAQNADPLGPDSGEAYAYRLHSGDWVLEEILVGGTSGDQFGASVAVGDNLAVVGAWADSVSGVGSGSAFVFRFEGVNWTPEAWLTASDGSSSDGFGYPVAVGGDVAVIGAYHDHGGTEIHSAYLFRGLSDCDDTDVLDLCEVAAGTSPDSNANGIPDECEAVVPTVSQWGLVVMAALLSLAGVSVLARRRTQ